MFSYYKQMSSEIDTSEIDNTQSTDNATSSKTITRYVIAAISFVATIVLIVACIVQFNKIGGGVATLGFVLSFMTLMIGVSELTTSDTILFHSFNPVTIVNSEAGDRVILSARPEVELTPFQHYWNIISQILIWIAFIIAVITIAVVLGAGGARL